MPASLSPDTFYLKYKLCCVAHARSLAHACTTCMGVLAHKRNLQWWRGVLQKFRSRLSLENKEFHVDRCLYSYRVASRYYRPKRVTKWTESCFEGLRRWDRIVRILCALRQTLVHPCSKHRLVQRRWSELDRHLMAFYWDGAHSTFQSQGGQKQPRHTLGAFLSPAFYQP